ncbi:MAG: BREX system P-loop protein BrxC [Eubacteriales bacterium]
MIIESMFEKPINRAYNGVIKVQQGTVDNRGQELEEYVVTEELLKHFSTFYSAYASSIKGNTEKMGVWISGFYGSGKSHLLKILSYLLSNQVIEGKTPLDYFLEGNKIPDAVLEGDMRLATQTPADVILFNVDSKSSTNSKNKNNKDAIMTVFLKAFNQHLGYFGGNPHIADFERKLTREGKYERFQEVYEEVAGESWQVGRREFRMSQSSVVEVLVSMGEMERDVALQTCKSLTQSYEFDIEQFAHLLEDYLRTKEKNHHIIFLVDEMGQYIGDDSKLMLNLQSVTEQFSTIGQGKIWVVVNSQEKMDNYTNFNVDDFSKIQGRFDTRLALSSTNANEVIEKRILAKNQAAQTALATLYGDNEVFLQSLLKFSDEAEKKLPTSGAEFAMVYPFMPYHFTLLKTVLTDIRQQGITGQHQSDGERSLLAMFKDTAESIMDQKMGALIPFHLFYDVLEKFVNHDYSTVIEAARRNGNINPQKETNCFAANVLKILLLTKNSRVLEGSVENITTLMVDHLNIDREELKEKVTVALQQLEREFYVLKHGDTYRFLSNEEQEISQTINSISVDLSKVNQKIAGIIYSELYTETSIGHPENFIPSAKFPFNQKLDGADYKSLPNAEFSLNILTPNYTEGKDDQTLLSLTSQEYSVVLVLPDKRRFVDELRMVLKIEAFLSTARKEGDQMAAVRYEKSKEMAEREKSAKSMLKDLLEEAVIFSQGKILSVKGKDAKARILEALSKLVGELYNKQSYITTNITKEEEVLKLLRESNSNQIAMVGANTNQNPLALDEMLRFIENNPLDDDGIPFKSVLDHFVKQPYGFGRINTMWLVAKLFKISDITLTKSKEELNVQTTKADEIFEYLNSIKHHTGLMLKKRVKAGAKEKKSVAEVLKELFNQQPTSSDDDDLIKDFRTGCERMSRDITKWNDRYYSHVGPYPGKEIVTKAENLFEAMLKKKNPTDFILSVHEWKDDFLDLAEDFEDIQKFFSTEQVKLWENNNKQLKIYEESKVFMTESEITKTADEMLAIQKNTSPFGKIQTLNQLHLTYREKYADLLEELAVPVLEEIGIRKKRVLDALENSLCDNSLEPKIRASFDDLEQQVKASNEMVKVISMIPLQTNKLMMDLLGDIQQEHLRLEEIQQKEATANTPSMPVETSSPDEIEAETTGPSGDGNETTETVVTKQVTPTPAPVASKPHKLLSIRNINKSSSWFIENTDDVEKYLDSLREELLKQLGNQENHNGIQIEF